MLNLDPETQCITCPQGDTGLLLASITALDGQPLAQPLDGVAVFAVCQQIGGVFSTIKAKQVELVDNTATILISNDFSRAIPTGKYYWDIRIVTDPELAEDGTVICQDETDEVHSLFAGRDGGMPQYIVPGVAVNV